MGIADTEEAPRILIADDDEIVRAVYLEALEEAGFQIVVASNGQEAIQHLSGDIAVAVLDLSMPGASGIDCLRHIQSHRPGVESIICTASTEVAHAVEAMKAGAYDYVVKPVDTDELVEVVRRALETIRLRQENRELRAAMGTPRIKTSFIGKSSAAQKVRKIAEKLARLESTVLITGESGVGKGLVARLIHELSPRRCGPFLGVSCTSLPRDLVEAELFGHEKGAFTGAYERRPGRLEVASGGTLLLDEVGDMPLDIQPKLLTFLQDRSFQRIGGSKMIDVDVRIIAATNQDLKSMCRDRQFREDLFFRLNVLPVFIPPLRERREDIRELTNHILQQVASRHGVETPGITDDAVELLYRYDWPGNVRELENILERTLAFLEKPEIRPADIPIETKSELAVLTPTTVSLAGLPLTEIEKIAILQTLELCEGNKSRAARTLGISEKSIYNKMKRLGVS